RPTGGQADSAPIVQTALAAGKALGFTSSTTSSSTDANIPISLGIPAIRIGGGGDAEGAHSLGEWYDDGPNGYLGPQWAALLVAALAGLHQCARIPSAISRLRRCWSRRRRARSSLPLRTTISSATRSCAS